MIDQSLHSPELGHGYEAHVYPLAGLTDKYVLRLEDGHSLDELKTTTYLTPVNHGFDKRSLAPPLLEGSGFSIHPLQPGKSLKQQFAKLAKANNEGGMLWDKADATAYVDQLKCMAALPQPIYETFLQDMNYLTLRRRGIDPHGDNIMMSESTLRWIDIGYKAENNHLQNVEAILFNFAESSEIKETRAIKELKLQIREKLSAAAKATHTPRNEEEAKAMMPAEHAFSHSQPITEIARVPLTATPAEVQKALSDIEQHIGKHF